MKKVSRMLHDKSFFGKMYRQRQLLIMSIPIMLYVILFFYVPLWGWTMAFQNFKPAKTFVNEVKGK